MEENTVPKKDYDELEKSIEKKKAFIGQLQERVQELMIPLMNYLSLGGKRFSKRKKTAIHHGQRSSFSLTP